MSSRLLQALSERVLVSDGAMGTQLMAAGLERGACAEVWNVTQPDRVAAIQARYVDAGADCLLTNTFGGNGISLARHGVQDRLSELNRAAVRVARMAFGDRPGFVLGDVGPIGALLEPYGELSVEDARDAITAQVRALVEAGVDAILVETQTALEEAEIGVAAARECGAPCIIASLAYDAMPGSPDVMTVMGVDPTTAAERLLKLGADVMALNCGTGIDMAVARSVVRAYREAGALYTMVQPNAGSPEVENGKLVYRQSPDDLVRPVASLLDAGANIVGGCCGTTPEHIRAIRREVDAWASSPADG